MKRFNKVGEGQSTLTVLHIHLSNGCLEAIAMRMYVMGR
ncbi:hypothetical protein SPWS13_0046 [Shewanella putrefaciens]|nr:hypothetical protein SPWS13_0046 [Shewanella putrefaciens]